MALETATYISDLVSTNPTASDAVSAGDDHIRLLKTTIKATFPNVSGAVTPTHTELNYVDGVTSAIQTQLDAKAPLASPTFTGTPAAPTAAADTNTTQIATTAFVRANRNVGELVLLGSSTGGGATVEFTGLTSTYDYFVLEIIRPAAASGTPDLWLRVSTNGGSSWETGGTSYSWVSASVGVSSTTHTGSTGDSKIVFSSVGTASQLTGSYVAELATFGVASRRAMIAWRGWTGGGATQPYIHGGANPIIDAPNAIQLSLSTGVNLSGTFRLWARRNS